MKVSEIMLSDPPVVTRDDAIATAARVIDSLDTSLLPVVASREARHVVGIITGRDVMRCTASGENPAQSSVQNYMSPDYESVQFGADIESALLETTVQTPFSDAATGSGSSEGQDGKRPAVVIDDQRRVVGLLTEPQLAVDPARVQSGQVVSARTESMQLMWRRTDRGYLLSRSAQLPDRCPDCGAPKEAFVLVTEDWSSRQSRCKTPNQRRGCE